MRGRACQPQSEAGRFRNLLVAGQIERPARKRKENGPGNVRVSDAGREAQYVHQVGPGGTREAADPEKDCKASKLAESNQSLP